MLGQQNNSIERVRCAVDKAGAPGLIFSCWRSKRAMYKLLFGIRKKHSIQIQNNSFGTNGCVCSQKSNNFVLFTAIKWRIPCVMKIIAEKWHAYTFTTNFCVLVLSIQLICNIFGELLIPTY